MTQALLIILLFATWTGLLLFTFLYKQVNVLLLRSDSKNLKWLRRLGWKKVRYKLLENYYSREGGYKTRSYFERWVKNSLAAKEFYVNNGFTEAKVAFIEILEEYERFVVKYKYNTFDNLTEFEREFIDNFQNPRNRRNKA